MDLSRKQLIVGASLLLAFVPRVLGQTKAYSSSTPEILVPIVLHLEQAILEAGGTGPFARYYQEETVDDKRYRSLNADSLAALIASYGLILDDLLTDPPEVASAAASNIGSSSAQLAGSVVSDGGEAVTSTGFKWGSSSTLVGASSAAGSANVGDFTADLSDLSPGSLYYFAAWAVNAKGTGYGDTLSFTTDATVPSLTTAAATAITAATATINGNISATGGADLIASGFEWSVNSDLSSSSDAAASGTFGDVSASLTSLAPFTTYYFSAYATNSEGTAHGDTLDFMTLATVPGASTLAATGVTHEVASLEGEVTATGGSAVTATGFIWGTDPQLAGGASVAGDALANAFSAQVAVSPTTTYYVSAFATNALGTDYGDTLSFTTGATVPSLTTAAATAITAATATINGNISATGGADLIASGFEWSVNSDLSSSSDAAASGTFGDVSASLTSLAPFTTYYFSAYATNSEGTAHGDTLDFMTLATVPGASTLAATGVTHEVASLEGEVTATGGSAVTATGFIWGTDPQLAGGASVAGDALANAFSAQVAVSPTTTYYVSAFATNALGTDYGDTLSFTTGAFVPAVFVNCGDELGYQGVNYATVLIGAQCWFADNLAATTTRTGASIPEVTENATWLGLSTPGRSQQAGYLESHGYFYNWWAVNQLELCPSGWGQATSAEFGTLAGNGWSAISATGTNNTGFGMQHGFRWDSGSYSFSTDWSKLMWADTPNSTNNGTAMELYQAGNSGWESSTAWDKNTGTAVRCLRQTP